MEEIRVKILDKDSPLVKVFNIITSQSDSFRYKDGPNRTVIENIDNPWTQLLYSVEKKFVNHFFTYSNQDSGSHVICLLRDRDGYLINSDYHDGFLFFTQPEDEIVEAIFKIAPDDLRLRMLVE